MILECASTFTGEKHFRFIQTTEEFMNELDIISVEQYNIFQLVNLTGLAQSISLFGIITNIINMMVFYRQGLNTTTNISFFALAISDLTCLITIEWYSVCLNPYLATDNVPFIGREITYLSGGWLHVSLGRITTWITVFVTAERCLGIAMPLKVKRIVTLRRTRVIMCFIYILNIGMLLPEYCIAYWDWKFIPSRNRSFVGMMYRSNKNDAYGLVYAMTSASGIISFLAVIFLTTFLVVKLIQKSSWRKKVTRNYDNSEATFTRDKKRVKMIVMLASVLIICYIPGTAVSLVTAFEPEFMLNGTYDRSFSAFWSIAFVFASINSSVNLILYYNMSTKYKNTLRKFVCKFKGN